jgi:malonyl-CoA/methylmalonyl-CoA synthetase
VNITLCALWAGAVCEAPGGFDPTYVWERFASGRLTLFMAVPTVYTRLIAAWEAADGKTRARWSSGASQLRLMVSGSAALPVSVLDRWHEIAGHVLLERYGMTEIGMGLSNTLERRVRGHVGVPLPGVEVRVVDERGVDVADDAAGELLVRGEQLFVEYWGRPGDTEAAFTDGWFRTGDVAARGADGYRILGRASVDIIKSGGEKISALEVEEVYRTHPSIGDCAVVGIPDDEWGEQVCAAVVPAPGCSPSVDELRGWGKERLAVAKVPKRFVVVDDLPRNAMGKVVKPEVSALLRGS